MVIYQTEPLDRAAACEALTVIETAISPTFLPQIFGIPVPISDTEITMRVFLADRHGTISTWLAARAIGASVVEAEVINTSAWYSYGALADWSGKKPRAPVAAIH